MACFHPLQAFRVPVSGIVTFNHREIHSNYDAALALCGLKLPCGQCVGCRLERSRQWAVRCMHEAQMHDANCFITLTYDNNHLPEGGTLVKSDFQKFFKRLRKKLGLPIRYYYCGEYGDKLGRPHYHAIIFGYDFPDQQLFSKGPGGELFTSRELESCWKLGFSTIGKCTFESAAYVARYVMKKVNGKMARDHYLRFDEDGVCRWLEPEYNNMSLKPAIGSEWIKKYHADVYPKDYFFLNKKRQRPVRAYDKFYEHLAPEAMKQIKLDRRAEAESRKFDNTPEALSAKELTLKSFLSMKERKYEK